MCTRFERPNPVPSAEGEILPNQSNKAVTRRDFMKSAVTTGVVMGAGVHSWAAETRSGDMIYRTLGRTGEKV